MSAKLLRSWTDENPDLHKQIGCMNGLFQLFDGHRFLTGRRTSHKKLPPAIQDGKDELATDITLQKTKLQEKNPKKAVKDKHRNSTESSRTSFSSSCSSTFSSLECNKPAQIEQSSTPETIPLETPSQDLPTNQSNASQLARRSLDLRDVVKDSINGETRGLSVKTKEEAINHPMKHIDSPRPLQPFKAVKPRVSGLNESLRVDSCLRLAPKDAPRLSYDGRESRYPLKSTIKLKELPRLSLDSKQSSIRGSGSTTPEFKSKYLLQNQTENGNINKILNSTQEPGSNKRPSGVVAKLMGLEDLPDSTSASENVDPFSRTSTAPNEIQQNRISGSPRNSTKDAVSPRLRNADSVIKPNSSSRIPIEAAPWRQSDGNRGPQNSASKNLEAPTKAPKSTPSVYGEIEKRLAELEFKKSGKDLRALKQILDAMQKTKEMLDIKTEDQALDSLFQTRNSSPDYNPRNQNSKLANQRNPQSNYVSVTIKEATSPQNNFGSPIVIMKPARFSRNSSNQASSIIPIEVLPRLNKLRTGDTAESRKGLVDRESDKDRTPRRNYIRNTSQPHHTADKNISPRTLRRAKTSKVLQHSTVENQTSAGKNSGALSPRLQQKNLRLEKQSHPTTPDSTRARRQSSRQPSEAGSPGRKLRPKSPSLQPSDEKLSEVSSVSHQGDASSLQSVSNVSLTSQNNTEVTSTYRPNEINVAFLQQSGQKHRNPAARLSENGSMAELATATREQPSPVSVLDAMFYRDESPSPVKKISNAFRDDETLNSDEPEWISVDLNHLSESTRSSLRFDIDHERFENIEELLQKLKQLSSSHDVPSSDDIAPICEIMNPDHKYISEILLASGLLLRDLSSGFTNIQLHSSGEPINPKLFSFLEQTKVKTMLSSNNDESIEKVSKPIPNDKFQRKLIFDAVNEILVRKTALVGSAQTRFLPKKLARRNPSGQHLLKELCSEIDQLQANSSHCSLKDEDDDDMRSILWEDLSKQPPDWTNFQCEVSGMVLDVERLIFKDLVSEIVSGESTGLRTKHCRQLFSK